MAIRLANGTNFKNLSIMETSIEFKRVNNDTNGNPRYVCHFFDLLTDKEQEEIRLKSKPFQYISDAYAEAVCKAKKIGGKKYNGKDFGGGIVFQSYNIRETENDILELLKD